MKGLHSAFFIVLIAMLIIPLNDAWCDLVVFGPVSGHWRAEDNPVVVIGATSVVLGDTLEIDPGVNVEFSGNYTFEIQGLLLALGTADSLITFLSRQEEPGSWGGIKFVRIGSTRSIMEFCLLRYGFRGIEWEESNARISNCTITHIERDGLRMENSHPVISECTITATGRNGITVADRSRPQIRDCRITQCAANGIGVGEASRPIISSNLIENITNYGIYLTEADSGLVEWNDIYHCGERGIYIRSTSGAYVRRNVIYDTAGPYGIELSHVPHIWLLNNTIYRNQQTGLNLFDVGGRVINNLIALNGQDGILFDGGDPQLRFNDVWGNSRDNYRGLDPGVGDLSVDPALQDPEQYNFTPSEGSPVIDAGDEASPPDPDGTRPDIGAKYFDQHDVITDDEAYMVSDFKLSAVFPNPFNSSARFDLTVAQDNILEISVWDLSGRKMLDVWNGKLVRGSHSFTINGAEFPAGVYILSAVSASSTLHRKFILIK